jgi:hypothetical protein
MFTGVPNVWVYVLCAQFALIGTWLLLFLYNRVEKRRKWALDLAEGCAKMGLADLATAAKDYAVGDYAGFVKEVVSFAKDVKDPKKRAQLLEEAVTDVVTYWAGHDGALAQKVLKILQSGTAVKNLSSTPATGTAT